MKKALEKEIERYEGIVENLKGDGDYMYYKGIKVGLLKALNILQKRS